ncbi:hypothetical protein [Undibacterium sp. SXout20W]|uniref:hypothetical protein n=1 Tax=Undibacterium sp. SXout20W TaxID=3413051 RepID=UPI003BF00028
MKKFAPFICTLFLAACASTDAPKDGAKVSATDPDDYVTGSNIPRHTKKDIKSMTPEELAFMQQDMAARANMSSTGNKGSK